ncbi:acyltransferase family protein [Aeromicrobium sp.]|uniref:acyltransferase family protein n=1 Tax=Aeromicrobium sp. TaxID=1871063 RepID=UPI0019BEC941|nr:acyltransferase family protein [Aeromicrobium sp.]MBC7632324.1 acyltransferase family protein [Aeromicrobium sp.]
MNRLRWVDTGRGVAIILVAVFHSTNWLLAVGFDLDAAVRVNLVLSSVRMPLFFAISGLFAAKWLDGQWRPLLRQKVILFLWVYAIWEIIGAAITYYGNGLNGDRGSIPAVIRHLMLSPVVPRFELWFIWALAIFFVAAKLSRRVDPRLQLGIAGIISLIALSGWDAPNVGWGGSLKYYAFFLAGIYLREQIFAFARIRRPVLMAGVIVAWAASSSVLVIFDLQVVPGLYFLNCVLGLLAGVCLGRALSGVSLIPYLGSRTLPIYLAHTPIIVSIALLLSVVDAVDSVSSPWIYGLAPVLAVMAIGLSMLLNRLAVSHGLSWLYEPPTLVVKMLGLAGPRRAAGARARRSGDPSSMSDSAPGKTG